jgi:hypothetical protein
MILLGLSIIGALVSVAVDDYGTCGQSVSQVYLSVVSDSPPSVPLQGARVSGNVQWLCTTDTPPGYITQYGTFSPKETPANGTLKLGTIAGNYSLSIQYQSQKYSTVFSPIAGQTFEAVLSLPSGSLRLLECSNDTLTDCSNATNS